MKKIIYPLSISIIGGIVALLIHNLNFDHNLSSKNIFPENKMVNISFDPNSISESSTNIDFTVAAEKTINSVVHVKNTSVSSGPSSVWDYFNNNQNNRTRVGMGSGVIVSKDGYIITNNHVIEEATTIEITTNNNKSYTANLIGTDEVADIAVLKIDSKETFPYIRFANSDQTKIGEWVLAVGNPYNLTSTVTAGIISAKSRDLNDYDSKNQSFIQTDAAVNSGNSGGALVNTSGDLIGINTAITSGTGGFVGYSFAVPSNVARKIFEDIIEFGNVQKGLLGVTGFGLNSRNANELNINLTEGFYVNDVEPTMGAAMAGIKKGDVILSLDNLKIAKFSDLSGYLSTKRPGDEILVGLTRDNKKLKLKVVLEKNENIDFYGMQIKNMSKEELETLDLDYGVKVLNHRNNTLYRMGINPGYIITEINGEAVKNTSEIKKFKNNIKISQITFVSPDGEKEKLIFE
ncbi:MAG: trypsin-like peptidase domain-containing protein [Flavobacteriaceae bacterium]|nr:trypsin-like peptidase domain-containing protein [Flavobacteriaceae bacterium]